MKENSTQTAASLRKRRYWRLAGWTVLGLFLTTMVVGGWIYHQLSMGAQCTVTLARSFLDFVQVDDRLLSREEYDEKIQRERGGHYFICAACGQPYVYRPVELPPLEDKFTNHRIKVIAWCPLHCHLGNERRVLFARGGSVGLSEKTFQQVIVNDFFFDLEDEEIFERRTPPGTEPSDGGRPPITIKE